MAIYYRHQRQPYLRMWVTWNGIVLVCGVCVSAFVVAQKSMVRPPKIKGRKPQKKKKLKGPTSKYIVYNEVYKLILILAKDLYLSTQLVISR